MIIFISQLYFKHHVYGTEKYVHDVNLSGAWSNHKFWWLTNHVMFYGGCVELNKIIILSKSCDVVGEIWIELDFQNQYGGGRNPSSKCIQAQKFYHRQFRTNWSKTYITVFFFLRNYL